MQERYCGSGFPRTEHVEGDLWYAIPNIPHCVGILLTGRGIDEELGVAAYGTPIAYSHYRRGKSTGREHTLYTLNSPTIIQTWVGYSIWGDVSALNDLIPIDWQRGPYVPYYGAPVIGMSGSSDVRPSFFIETESPRNITWMEQRPRSSNGNDVSRTWHYLVWITDKLRKHDLTV